MTTFHQVWTLSYLILDANRWNYIFSYFPVEGFGAFLHQTQLVTSQSCNSHHLPAPGSIQRLKGWWCHLGTWPTRGRGSIKLDGGHRDFTSFNFRWFRPTSALFYRTQEHKEYWNSPTLSLSLWTSLAFASVTCDVVSNLITLQETKGITVINYLFQAP